MRYDASKYIKRPAIKLTTHRYVDIDGMMRRDEEMSSEISRLNQKVEELETLLSFVIHTLQTGHDFASCDSEFLMELDSLFLNGGVCN